LIINLGYDMLVFGKKGGGLGLSPASAAYRSLRVIGSRTAATHSGSNGENGRPEQGPPGYLCFEDGTIFKGRSFGAEKSQPGEIVFTTNMVGYPESMTDPSFAGQILNLTFPLIGNYGVPGDELDAVGLRRYFESSRIWCDGLLVGDYSDNYAHWNAKRSLGEWLKDENVPALTGIDTRAVTKKIREGGSMLGKIVIGEKPEDVPFVDINKQNLVARVSTSDVKVFNPDGDVHVIAVDCGMKGNIIRCLVERGAKVTVVPYDYDFNNHPEKWDGLFLSNGPGDPSMCEKTVSHVRTAMDMDMPIFGICLGNQLMAIAAGFETYKLKYGNRGQNQPVVDLLTNQAYITPQNHGFAVNHRDLPDQWRPYFINANDRSNEGIIHTMKPFFFCPISPRGARWPL
jgi:carbamoyl-phosphate synthase small subunit